MGKIVRWEGTQRKLEERSLVDFSGPSIFGQTERDRKREERSLVDLSGPSIFSQIERGGQPY